MKNDNGLRARSRRTLALSLATAVVACGAAAASSARHASGPGGEAVGGLAGAQQVVKQLKGVATVIAPREKLRKTPPTGKLIVDLQTPTNGPLIISYGQELQKAAATLGWKVKLINTKGTVADVQAALTQALQLHPNGIIDFDGLPLADFAPQIAAAKAQGVPLVWDAAPLPKLKFPVIGGQGTHAFQKLQTKALTAWIAADSGGKAHVGMLTVESIPALKDFDNYFKQYLTFYCPGCQYTLIDNQVTDIGTKMPTNAVSKIQADSSINYLTTPSGAFYTGVPAALQTAGFTSVKITGTNPLPADLQAVGAGTEAAWMGTDLTWFAWYNIDSFARYYTGTPLVTDAQYPCPIHIVDKNSYRTKNAAGQPVDVNNGIVYTSMTNQFKTDWHVTK